jgi:hypothetical protein
MIVLLLAVVLSNDSSAAKQNPHLDKYRDAATRCHGGDYSLVRQELENAPIDGVQQELDAAGVLLCEQPELAAGLLDSIKNEMLRAELLLRLAIGSRDSRGRRTCRLDDSFASRAAKLLDSKDPFVRGIADWALAIRVGTDNDGRRFWPRPEDSAWFEALAMGRPQHRLKNDYVRQAVVSGIHYSPKTLSESATQMIDRAEWFVAAFNASFSVSDRDTIAAELQVMARLLGRLQTLADVESVSVEATAAARRHWLDMRHAARRIVDCHLAKACPELAYVTRYSCIGPHNLASYSYHPTHFRPGGDVVIQSGSSPTSPTRALLRGRLGDGHVRGIDLHWDAERFVFAFTPQPGWNNEPVSDGGSYPEPTHLYEMKVDGSGLEQLTNDRKWIDTEPTYLPCGDVAFSSDRCAIGSECGSFRQNAGTLNLYRLDRAAGQIRRLTVNKDYDRYPHCLDNGLIAYLHWDYTERQFYSPHSIWTVRPDGSMADAVFKAHVQGGPFSLRDARSIPDTSRLVAVACGHHNRAEGSVAIVDPSRGINRREAMRYVTPYAGNTEGGYGNVAAVAEGGVPTRGGLYQHPWAISDKSFLVSYAYDYPKSSSFAVYYIDVFGHHELIRADSVLECAFPMPLTVRPTPPILPDNTIGEGIDLFTNVGKQGKVAGAVCYLADVHADLPGIEPGTVKYLRISERVNWPFDKSPRGEIRWLPGNPYFPQFGYWSWAPVRVLGIVPVEADGSAYFHVPSGQAVYFQALDENYLEIRRMRGHVSFQPGEVRGCTGCHESRSDQAPYIDWPTRLASTREPSRPRPPAWGDRELIDYETTIQPILDRHCVRCHSPKTKDAEAAAIDLTAARQPDGFFQSYRTMFGLKRGQQTPVAGDTQWPTWPADTQLQDKDWYRRLLLGELSDQLVVVSDRTSAPWQRPVDASISQPKEFGSHRSRLITTLLKDPLHRREIKLEEEQWISLVTWVDANAPYHATFFQKFDERGTPLPEPIRVPIELQPVRY